VSEQPNPSWSREKMASYMKEKYGEPSKVTDKQTGRRLSWDEVVKLWDSPVPKEPKA
jgi:hypothetical protein